MVVVTGECFGESGVAARCRSAQLPVVWAAQRFRIVSSGLPLRGPPFVPRLYPNPNGFIYNLRTTRKRRLVDRVPCRTRSRANARPSLADRLPRPLLPLLRRSRRHVCPLSSPPELLERAFHHRFRHAPNLRNGPKSCQGFFDGRAAPPIQSFPQSLPCTRDRLGPVARGIPIFRGCANAFEVYLFRRTNIKA